MMKKILIVDDEYDIVEPLSVLFSENGFDVQVVMKGDEVYKKVEHFRPHAILLDVLMSGSDGRTICRNLKKNKKTKHIPIIMMSAHPNAQKDSEGCEADAFVPKPFNSQELISLVGKIATS